MSSIGALHRPSISQAPIYLIADMAVWPWMADLAKGLLYGAGEFLQVQEYANVQRWTDAIARRPAAQRGRKVNRTWGEPSDPAARTP